MEKEINNLNKKIHKIAAGMGAICCGVVMTGSGSRIYAQTNGVAVSNSSEVVINEESLKSFSDDYFTESMKESSLRFLQRLTQKPWLWISEIMVT